MHMIYYSIMSQQHHTQCCQYEYEWNWRFKGSIVYGTVRTLGTATHFTNIQQICGQRIENGFVKSF
jgi:hypothetical protein